MSKITRKSYKRKKIIMGAALFGAIGLVSTGFAAWVLSNSVTTTKEASLSVGLVDDKNMEFKDVVIKTTGTNNENNVYHFEPAADDSTGRVRWDGTNSELLSLTVSGRLLHTQNLGNIQAKVATVATGTEVTAEQAKARLDEAITKGYVVAPVFYQSTDVKIWEGSVVTDYSSLVTVGDQTAIEESETDKERSFSIEVKFAWGTAFGGDNPSEYYDSNAGKDVPQGKAGDTYESGTVAGYLTDLHTLLDGITIQLTLTANPS